MCVCSFSDLAGLALARVCSLQACCLTLRPNGRRNYLRWILIDYSTQGSLSFFLTTKDDDRVPRSISPLSTSPVSSYIKQGWPQKWREEQRMHTLSDEWLSSQFFFNRFPVYHCSLEEEEEEEEALSHVCMAPSIRPFLLWWRRLRLRFLMNANPPV